MLNELDDFLGLSPTPVEEDHSRPHFQALPTEGKAIDFIDTIASALWENSDYPVLTEKMLAIECDRLIAASPTGEGWWRWNGRWGKVDQLPPAIALDVESDLDGEEWIATMATAIGSDGAHYEWAGRGLIPLRGVKLVIGHNASEHDSQFVEESYRVPSKERIAYLDTRAMVESLYGVVPSQQGAYEKFKAQMDKGKGVPGWATVATRSNLADAVERVLGLRIHKTTQGGLFEGVKAPTSRSEYCHQDTWATLKLFQRLSVHLQPSPVRWTSQAVTGLRVSAPHWDAGLKTIRAFYDESLKAKKRTAAQASMVQWGKSHLSRMEKAIAHNEVLPLRVNPGDVFSMPTGDLNGWFEVSIVESECDFIAKPSGDWEGYPIYSGIVTGLFGEVPPYTNQFRDIQVTVPKHKPLGAATLTNLVSTPRLKSPVLGIECPKSIVGETVKKEWLLGVMRVEPLMLFIPLMEAFILEYDLNAWLSVPGEFHCSYSMPVKTDEIAIRQLIRCGAESARIVEKALNNLVLS